MTKNREKKNLRIRFCQVNIAGSCQAVFEAKRKRVEACNYCKQKLNENGLNVEIFLNLKRRADDSVRIRHFINNLKR